MKATFKPLALATAVAAVTAGYTGVTQAQIEPGLGIPQFAGTSNLGDAAIVPYYTVNGDFVTGVHITNTSATRTQVVKLRYRRAKDSMDALDFNIILSPLDVWTGSLGTEPGVNGDTIRVYTEDNSCTAPQLVDKRASMGDIFRDGAEEGYIEVIGMASIDSSSAMAIAAGHATSGATKGQPLNCDAVESNFFRQATVRPLVPDLDGLSNNGVYSSEHTVQTCTEDVIPFIEGAATQGCAVRGENFLNDFADTGNVLKVSWFVRSVDSGTEFGGNAVHIANLSNAPMMSNQEIIITDSIDYYSFLYPDLDGGTPAPCENPNFWDEFDDVELDLCEEGIDLPDFDNRGRYNAVRDALGAASIVNDWSVNPANGVSTDWVVTLPGQYLMLNLPVYLDAENGLTTCYDHGTATELNAGVPTSSPQFPVCDARDLPVEVTFVTLDREEAGFTNPEGGLVISPQTTDTPATAMLPYEVNVIEWTDGTNEPVLDSNFVTSANVAALGSPYGWAELRVTSDPTPTKQIGIANHAIMGALNPAYAQDPFDYQVDRDVPIVGFAAWERSFDANPDANYGRAVDHSYTGVPSLSF